MLRTSEVRRLRFRHESGQAILLVALLMPVFLGFGALVIDGSKAYVQKVHLQGAADAAALAATRELQPALNPTCDAACMTSTRAAVADTARQYLEKNNVPSVPNPLPPCDSSHPTCYTWPFSGSTAKVEVEVQADEIPFIAQAAGFATNIFKPRARAVAAAHGSSTQHCSFPGQTIANPDQYAPTCVITGTTVAAPSGAMAFTMSRACDAILWTGSTSGDPTLGSLGTNGGLNFTGANGKRVKQLGFNRRSVSNPTGCADPAAPTPCTATAWGDPSDSSPVNTCVKTLTDWSAQVPMNWTVTTTVPTPLASGTWSASSDYGLNCTNLTGSPTFTPNATLTADSGPPGVYCLTTTNGTLTLGTGSNNDFAGFGTGEGYTFFALNGSKIMTASNGTTLRSYWPAGCGTRPPADLATRVVHLLQPNHHRVRPADPPLRDQHGEQQRQLHAERHLHQRQQRDFDRRRVCHFPEYVPASKSAGDDRRRHLFRRYHCVWGRRLSPVLVADVPGEPRELHRHRPAGQLQLQLPHAAGDHESEPVRGRWMRLHRHADDHRRGRRPQPGRVDPRPPCRASLSSRASRGASRARSHACRPGSSLPSIVAAPCRTSPTPSSVSGTIRRGSENKRTESPQHVFADIGRRARRRKARRTPHGLRASTGTRVPSSKTGSSGALLRTWRIAERR